MMSGVRLSVIYFFGFPCSRQETLAAALVSSREGVSFKRRKSVLG